MAEEKYTGIVLTGGKNSRMGREKGLIPWKGMTLAEHAIKIISPFCTKIIISANNNNYDSLGYTVLSDQYPDCGPMGGILTCLKQSQTDQNLVIPSDMPFVRPEIYSHLMQQEGKYDIIVPIDHKSWLQPLCAIFHRSIIPAMEEQVSLGILGFTPLIRKVSSRKVPFQLNKGHYNQMIFFNINSAADLEEIS